MLEAMKPLVALLFAVVLCPALAQPGQGRWQGDPGRQMQREGRYMQRDYGRPMPAPERRQSWEDRQRLREQIRDGDMTRDEARQRWREQRERRGYEPGRSPEERQRLRRDIQEWNRDLERR
jgi:hypothetical protein